MREANRGDSEAAGERLKQLREIPVLDLTEESRDLAKKIVGPGMIPPKYYEDALHVAIATAHGMDYLLTWNLAHIANATLRRQYEQVIGRHGYDPPIVCTPEELKTEP
jgi:hypothetical protein